jgi:hypothetical protein
MGRLCTVDLLVLTSLDQLVFLMSILVNFHTKQATLIRRSTVLSLPPPLVSIPCPKHHILLQTLLLTS